MPDIPNMDAKRSFGRGLLQLETNPVVCHSYFDGYTICSRGIHTPKLRDLEISATSQSTIDTPLAIHSVKCPQGL